ncbi:MAG TPA: hypothetical protein VK468_03490, partial [Pyrinomonadaceae bacterium]|nr:hypothetical protein [Pyrinomonadaceae bacterium]
TISKDKKRYLGTTEAKINLFGGGMLSALGIVAIFFPRVLSIPLGLIALWLAVSLFINSYQLFKQAGKGGDDKHKG